MPSYKYRAKSGPEKVVEGVIEASSEAAAIEKINQMGYIPVRIDAHLRSEAVPQRSPVVFRASGKRNLQVISLSRHLASLLKSGVPLLRAIKILAEEEKDRNFKALLEVMADEVRKGSTLSQAMEARPESFSRMYLSIVRAGESSGGLEEALLRLATYLKKKEDFGRKVRHALAYPIFLSAAGFLTILFILTFMVPRLTKLFAGMDRELPLPTTLILTIGNWMQYYGVFLIVAAMVGGSLFARVFGRHFGRSFFDAIKLRIPFLKGLWLKIEFSRFARTLELSLGNGLSFLDAMRVSIPTVDNSSIRESLENCYRQVQKGDSFARALKNDPHFSDFSVNLILVGEESGSLRQVLTEIADSYEEETDELVVYLTTLLEPVLILAVGAIVGFIVMAMLLPIFEMNAVF